MWCGFGLHLCACARCPGGTKVFGLGGAKQASLVTYKCARVGVCARFACQPYTCAMCDSAKHAGLSTRTGTYTVCSYAAALWGAHGLTDINTHTQNEHARNTVQTSTT